MMLVIRVLFVLFVGLSLSVLIDNEVLLLVCVV